MSEGKLASGATSAACDSGVRWDQALADFNKAKPAETARLDFRHADRMNVVYADGHVGAIPFKNRSAIKQWNWEGRNYPN